ncbi:hypothetical protein C471_15872 [Halorubrum saccharovorum DSM 1137]|uniref:Uncharacterized protein n=1 Tax=Halorubrum saccharovorum DSM 1137 TaxID=1227484 RepID=M0DN97_9EURY|nr:hypothetical protein C471_15872 [Halorubrum saccharovorum DSM 1137]
MFNDAGRDLALYSAVHQLWYDVVGDRDDEPGIAAEVDHDVLPWLDAPTPGREWVVKLTSSRWKAGTGTGDDYSAYYKYDLTLRERDEDGDVDDCDPPCRRERLRLSEEEQRPHGDPGDGDDRAGLGSDAEQPGLRRRHGDRGADGAGEEPVLSDAHQAAANHRDG